MKETCCRSSVVEHSLGRLTCLPGWKRSGANRPKSGKAKGRKAYADPEPSPVPPGRCRGQTGGTYGPRGHGEGMVQPANRMGRESGSGMKGEVDSSILSGSTTSRLRLTTLPRLGSRFRIPLPAPNFLYSFRGL